MSYSLFRAVYKEIATLNKKDTFLAEAIRKNIKTHLSAYYKSRERMNKKIKKQQDHQLVTAFLSFLKLVNLPNQHKGHIARIKLAEMVLGLNCEVDEHFNLRRDQNSTQIKFLYKYDQYNKLSAKDKEFVKKILKQVFQGEETYTHPNLTSFFKDQKQNFPDSTPNKEPNTRLYEIEPTKKQYIEKIINGEIPGVSKEFIRIYSHILNTKVSEKSNLDLILQSYEQSNYILLDFDDLSVKK